MGNFCFAFLERISQHFFSRVGRQNCLWYLSVRSVTIIHVHAHIRIWFAYNPQLNFNHFSQFELSHKRYLYFYKTKLFVLGLFPRYFVYTYTIVTKNIYTFLIHFSQFTNSSLFTVLIMILVIHCCLLVLNIAYMLLFTIVFYII